MSRRGTDYCRVVVVTSLAWMFSMSILFVYLLDSGVRTGHPIAAPDNIRYRNSASDVEHKVISSGEKDKKEYEEWLAKPENEARKKARAASDRRRAESVREREKQYQEEKPKSLQVDQKTAEVEGILAKLMRGLSLSSGGPGESGRPVHVPYGREAESKRLFKANQFNVMISDMISLNRSLPDYRSSKCRSKTYESDLPGVSIIIVFHNEAWSTLLRSLHSVVNRSPPEMLHEIILVDDFSDRDYLRDPLAAYLKRLPVRTQLVHMPERSGLIRARLRGAGLATGQVLLFLDAHVEVTKGWLPPLLARVKENRQAVVAPIIDVISDDTFEYVTASDMTWGGFNWHLNFRWYPVPQRELNRRGGDRSQPIQTPTIAGGLFAIDKNYFYEIGTYDEGMQVWGGENLEISFRVWMCGGVLEIMPCSRVGHVFRKQTPYTFPGGTATVIHRNAARTAEVWMDEYKDFFYQIVPGARTVELGSVEDRLALRKKLHCKSFRWYLENVYKESPVPLDFLSIGSIKTPESGGPGYQCLDTMGHKEGQDAGMTTCHGMGGNQAWSLTGTGHLRADEICLVSDGRGTVSLAKCSDNYDDQVWRYEPETHRILHVASKSCLAGYGQELMVAACSDRAAGQFWIIDSYKTAGQKKSRRRDEE